MRRFWRRLIKTTAIAATFLPTVYGFLAWRYWSNPPQLKRNFAAELNAPVERHANEKRAWPAYRDAIIDLQEDAPQTWRSAWTSRQIVDDTDAAKHLRSHESALAKIRVASQLPSLGFLLSNATSTADRRLMTCDAPPEIRAARNTAPIMQPDVNPQLMSVLLIPAGETSRLFLALEADAELAAAGGDGARMIEDLLTMMRAAEHLREIPLVVNDLRANSRFSQAMLAWGRLLERSPELFTVERLQTLEAEARKFGGGVVRPRFTGERLIFYDLVQRLYTDDGNGDGHFYATEMDSALEGRSKQGLWLKIMAPLTTGRFHSRRTVVEAYDRLIEQLDSDCQQPLWKGDFSASESLMDELALDPRHHLIRLLAPNLPNLWPGFEQLEQQRNALLIASAVHRYRLGHSKWPTSLDDLVPTFLSKVPLDRIDGKPLRYRLVEDRPLLYSPGFDGEDNLGKPALVRRDHPFEATTKLELPWHTHFVQFRSEPPQGDLILWPVEPKELREIKRAKFDEFGVPITE